MRLIDLDPHWIGLLNAADGVKFYVGVSFLCPHCPADAPLHGPVRRRRLAVSFWPPIDPDNWLPRMAGEPKPPHPHKRLRGETFETLTLHPSVGFDSIGHWHGTIVDGVCTP